jgi:uncharacterized protein
MTKDLNILQETLARLKTLYKQEGLQPVHLVKIGIKPQWNVVIGTHGNCGMAINFTGVHQVHGDQDMELTKLQSLVGKDLFEVAASLLRTGTLQGRSIGAAAMSSLSQPLLTSQSLAKRGLVMREGMTDIATLVRPGDVVSLVGYGGIVTRLVGKCREIHVTDMRPLKTLRTTIIGERIEYGPREVSIHGAEENKAVLGRSDVVFVTASTLVNDTFGEVMSYADKARLVGLYGPTGSMIPDVLFERGADFVMTFSATDPKKFEHDMMNDLDMERSAKDSQRQQFMMRSASVLAAG